VGLNLIDPAIKEREEALDTAVGQFSHRDLTSAKLVRKSATVVDGFDGLAEFAG
jgi:hypothetical protein